jgi:H+/Cl- antiporter ClcA
MNDYEQGSTHTLLDGEPQRKSLLLGIVGALVGAIVGSIPWMIAFNFNWFVGILGALIGLCAMKGYEFLKGPEGKVKIVVIVTISLIIVVLAQYVTTIFAVYREFQGERFAPTLLDTMDLLNDMLFADPEVTRYFLIDAGMGIFFALLGLSGIFKEKPVKIVKEEKTTDDTGSDDQGDLSDHDF